MLPSEQREVIQNVLQDINHATTALHGRCDAIFLISYAYGGKNWTRAALKHGRQHSSERAKAMEAAVKEEARTTIAQFAKVGVPTELFVGVPGFSIEDMTPVRDSEGLSALNPEATRLRQEARDLGVRLTDRHDGQDNGLGPLSIREARPVACNTWHKCDCPDEETNYKVAGTSMAHVKAWQRVARQGGRGYTVVLEADACPAPGARDQFWAIAERLLAFGHGRRADFIWLGHEGDPANRGPNDDVLVPGVSLNLQGYAVTAQGASLLLAAAQHFTVMITDVFVACLGKKQDSQSAPLLPHEMGLFRSYLSNVHAMRKIYHFDPPPGANDFANSAQGLIVQRCSHREGRRLPYPATANETLAASGNLRRTLPLAAASNSGSKSNHNAHRAGNGSESRATAGGGNRFARQATIRTHPSVDMFWRAFWRSLALTVVGVVSVGACFHAIRFGSHTLRQ